MIRMTVSVFGKRLIVCDVKDGSEPVAFTSFVSKGVFGCRYCEILWRILPHVLWNLLVRRTGAPIGGQHAILIQMDR